MANYIYLLIINNLFVRFTYITVKEILMDDILPLPTTSHYIARMLGVDDHEDQAVSDFYDDDDNYNQIKLISNILATENAIYLLRRSNETCGSHTDTMVRIRRKFIEEYEDYCDVKWIDANEESMY